MIGNDVVDLQVAQKESNWKRKGYLDKIYTIAEQDIIYSASNPDLMVWILWSMKEAAYKANNRISGIREYAPTKIRCELVYREDNFYYGKAIYNKTEYQIKIFIFQEYIHTIALCKTMDFSTIKVFIVEDYPLDYSAYLKEIEILKPDECIIKNKFGIPNIFDEITNEIKPISISHHGSFLGLLSIKD